MLEPVIAIGIGFFIILCLLVKFTGINDITPDIIDTDTDIDQLDLVDIKNIDDIDTSKYNIVQTYYDLDAPIPFVNNNINENILKDNTVYLIYKKEDNNENEQLSQLIEPEPIQDNGNIQNKYSPHILDFSSKEKDLMDLSGTTLISLKSIKQ